MSFLSYVKFSFIYLCKYSRSSFLLLFFRYLLLVLSYTALILPSMSLNCTLFLLYSLLSLYRFWMNSYNTLLFKFFCDSVQAIIYLIVLLAIVPPNHLLIHWLNDYLHVCGSAGNQLVLAGFSWVGFFCMCLSSYLNQTETREGSSSYGDCRGKRKQMETFKKI